ncbi:MAG: ABC transporter permease [Ignavibacteriales bacterium]|nr:ABC transporter permease [Ignavibacteriales bacterium]
MKFDIKELPTHLGKLSNVGTIFKKELRSYFNSAVAYVVIVVFLAIVGWMYTSSMFLINVASLRMMFELIPLVFLFVVPAVTMRLLAEEKKAGTIELLTTKPLHDWEIVAGKFLAAWALIGFALLPTLIYYITVVFLGDIDNGPVIGGYLGLLFMAGVYVAIGLLASSLTENQIVAFIVGLLLMFVFYMMDKVLIFVPDFMTSVVEYLGIDFHFSNIARGVIDSRDIVYFGSVLGFTLYLSVISLERRKW